MKPKITTITLLTAAWLSNLNAQDNHTTAYHPIVDKKEEVSEILSPKEDHTTYNGFIEKKYEISSTLHDNDVHHPKNIISVRWTTTHDPKNTFGNTTNIWLWFWHTFGDKNPFIAWAGVSIKDMNIYFGKEFELSGHNSIWAEIEIWKEYEYIKERFYKWLELCIGPRFNTPKVSCWLMIWTHLDDIKHHGLQPIIKLWLDFNMPITKKNK